MLSEKRTLVILSPGFPKDTDDTTCLPLQQSLISNIKQNHPELELVVLAFQYPFKGKAYTWNGIPVKAFAGRSRGKLFRFHNWARVWASLNKLHRTKKVAGILSFWLGECAFIGERFAKKHQLKHYCWILGQDAKPGNRYFKMAGMKAGSLLALSDFIARNMYINYGVMPRHIIPGGIDETEFKPAPLKKDIDVLAAGSLITLKQYHLFIEAVCRLHKHFPDIKAVLCGDGPDKARLTRMVAKLKMEHHIILTGELPHDEVLELMQRSKVFIHTSNYEGLGMVCLEALYAGAKVISFVKPMEDAIPNWYHAETTYQMAGIAQSILHDVFTEYMPVMPYSMKDIATQVANLYLDKPLATSLKRSAIAPKESVV